MSDYKRSKEKFLGSQTESDSLRTKEATGNWIWACMQEKNVTLRKWVEFLNHH